jgi:hypothetical protein
LYGIAVCFDMHTIIETPTYLSDAKYVGLDEDDRNRVLEVLARNPTLGDLVEGSGGLRKVRVARRGGGKSGGFRVLAAYLGPNLPVILLAVFAKNEKANISKSDLKILTRTLETIKTQLGEKRLKS